MKIFIWLMKIPGLAWPFFRVLLPIWNFVWSNLEAFCHLRKRGSAVKILRALDVSADSAALLEKWYNEREFVWRKDPLRGLLDYSSTPWVSVARNAGDCDDMMLMAEHVLKSKYDEGHRCYIYASDGRSHAIYLLRIDKTWFVMSNQHFMGSFQTMGLAIRRFFQDKTLWFYVI